MKSFLFLAATLGAAMALSAQTPTKDQTRTQDRVQAKDQTRTQDRVQAKDQTRTQDQKRLQKQDGSCGQTPGTGAGRATRTQGRRGH